MFYSNWTEKYRPTGEDNWIGDKSAVSSLVDFVNKPRKNPQNGVDEDEDELVPTSATTANAVLLTGCHGHGKTCLVYAVAQQSNMKVLEMNSSSKRAGKIVMSMLKEATQTYHLNMKNNKPTVPSNSGIAKFFIRRSPFEANNNNNTLQQSSATSSQPKKFCPQIILFDDVDVIYEGKDKSKEEDLDVGFWHSLKQLIRETKVPVILTATDCAENILHAKLSDVPLLKIHIPKPSLIEVRSHLMNICSKEFTPASDVNLLSNESINRLDDLIMSSSCDLRKCINQLNFAGELFFAPISVPKAQPKTKTAQRKRGRGRKAIKANPLEPLLNSIITSDLAHYSSADFDLSSLVLESNSSLAPEKATLAQRLDKVIITDHLDSVLGTTGKFINSSFNSLTCRPSLLSCKSDQILDILPFLSVICQEEAKKSFVKEPIGPPERKKTRRQTRLQGLPYFDSIESFQLNHEFREALCSVYNHLASSFELFDTEATDIDE